MTDTRSRAAAESGAAPESLSADQPAHIRTFETVIRVPGDLTGGALAVLEHRLPPGALAMPRHSHAAAEALTVLSGELHVEVARDIRVLGAGQSLAVHPGASHTFWVSVDAAGPCTLVAVVAPAGIERYYLEVSRAILAGGRPDMPAIHAASARHGVDVDMESLFELIARHTLQLS